MKKYINKILGFTALTIVVFLNTTIVNAVEKCSIEETPEYIEKYIENVHKIVNNTNKLVSEKIKTIDKTQKNKLFRLKLRTIGHVQGSLNRLFNWEGYETDIEYTIQENISEIPKQLKRDVNLLQKESRNIKLANPSGGQIEVKGSELCEGIENCNFEPNKKYKALKIIELLKKSTNKIRDIIKNQATDFNFNSNIKVYLLNPKQLLIEYSKENIQQCNLYENENGDKGFFAIIKNGIKKISFLNKNSKNGMSQWQEAVDLLYGRGDISKYRQKERELLTKELQKQGIGGHNASAIISNLDAYNQSQPGKNPFLKGKQGFFNSLQLQLEEFNEAIETKFKGYKNGTSNIKEFSTKEINDEIKKLKQIENTNIDIKSKYIQLKSLAIDEDINNDKLLYKLIDIHVSISEMINTLNKTCFLSVKVCNDQKTGQGNCGQCY